MRPELVFVGTGEALDPELPNTSLLLRGPQTMLLDCGYAVPHAFWRITRDVDLLDAIWISHTHADHVFGLPPLLLWMRLGGRERPLTILCGPGQASKLEQLLELGYPGSYAPHKCYPIHFIELAREGVSRFGDYTLRIAPSAHSIVNYALRLEAPGLRSLVYSGDGSPTEATRELCRGVSVLVHECFFPGAGDSNRTADDAPAVPPGSRRGPPISPLHASHAWGPKHGGVDSCLELARASAVETLVLLHFASEAKQAIRERAGVRESFEILLPNPGDTLALGNRE